MKKASPDVTLPIAMDDDKTGYCLGCGQEVESFNMLVDGKEVLHCFLCGMPLGDKPEVASKPKIKTLDQIMLADDSALAREVIIDKLVELKAARKVVALKNGEEFIEAFTRKMVDKTPPQLVILDIRMPGMNGINAGLSLRCIEKGFGVAKPVPLLFFSSVVCDDSLKAAMTKLKPARYINKGSGGTQDELASRIVGVISKLLGG